MSNKDHFQKPLSEGKLIMALLPIAPIDWFSGKHPKKEDNKIQSKFWHHRHFQECLYFWDYLHICGPVHFFPGVFLGSMLPQYIALSVSFVLFG